MEVRSESRKFTYNDERNYQQKILNENHTGDLKNIILEKSPYGFDDMMDDYEVPFDCNEF